MPTLRVKGHHIDYTPIRDSANRRAVQIANRIVQTLGKVQIKPDDIEVEEERMPMRKARAKVRWYFDGHHCLYSYVRAHSHIDNLQVVSKLLEIETQEVLSGKKPLAQFIADFEEDPEVEQKRKEAREALGFAHDHHDLESINAEFKKRSRAHHPDMPGGDAAKFKELNEAHKTLRRELE